MPHTKGRLRNMSKKIFFISMISSLALVCYYSNLKVDFLRKLNINDIAKIKENNIKLHQIQVNSLKDKRQDWTTSNLGSILFKFEELSKYKNPRQNRTFTVLIWKYWGWLKHRHIYQGEALGDCSVQNCRFSGENILLHTADAVVVHLQSGEIPHVGMRNPHQRWIFLSDESPIHSFTMAKRKTDWRDFQYVFNWSMTFRSDADVPVPYGRTTPLSSPRITDFVFSTEIIDLIPNWNRKRYDVLVTVLISNCSVKKRMNFINDLKKHMTVDVFGKCSDSKENKNKCPGHIRSDCAPMSEYLFYLVMENSLCSQYITEKIFYHAYSRGAIPVIMGISREDCESLLPPNSYLHVDDTTNLQDLAKEMVAISQNNDLLLSYHMWRNNFKVLNEHGYFGSKSYHLCRVCEALNYNDESPKVYGKNELGKFLDSGLLCKRYAN